MAAGSRHWFSWMLSSIAAESSAPVGPPRARRGTSRRACRSRRGSPRSPMITSACSPRTGSSRLPLRTPPGLEAEPDGVLPRHLDGLFGQIGPDDPLGAQPGRHEREHPAPQPTSITVSPGAISSASAMVRLVWLGWNTLTERDREGAGPPSIRAWSLPLGRLADRSPSYGAGCGWGQSTSRLSDARRHEHGISAVPRTSPVSASASASASATDGLSTPRWPDGYARIRPDARRSNRFAPCIASKEVDVASPQLGQTLEELRVGRVP